MADPGDKMCPGFVIDITFWNCLYQRASFVVVVSCKRDIDRVTK